MIIIVFKPRKAEKSYFPPRRQNTTLQKRFFPISVKNFSTMPHFLLKSILSQQFSKLRKTYVLKKSEKITLNTMCSGVQKSPKPFLQCSVRVFPSAQVTKLHPHCFPDHPVGIHRGWSSSSRVAKVISAHLDKPLIFKLRQL